MKKNIGTVRHILVVDDDSRIRELLRHYLVDHGYYVTTATDAVDARLQMNIFSFNILVLDIMMPGEDGLMFTASLRERTDIPILLLTARG